MPWRGSCIVSYGYYIGSLPEVPQAILSHKKQKRKEKSTMRHRAKTRKSVDKRIFARTGMRTKKMNVTPKILRGGIML